MMLVGQAVRVGVRRFDADYGRYGKEDMIKFCR